MIDYKKEYFNLIKERGLTTLPRKEVLDENRDLAIYVWNKMVYQEFDEQYNLSIVKEYENYNVKEVFDKYKDDIDFWSAVIKVEDNFELLFNPQFKKDFGFAYEALINDKELLKEIYANANKFVNTDKLVSLFSENDRNIAFQERAKKGNFSFEFIINNIDLFDDEFILNYIPINPSIYSYLPEEKKNELKFINLYINNYENFVDLSEENKLKVFDEKKFLEFLGNEENYRAKHKMFNALNDEQKNDMKFIKAYIGNNDWEAFFNLTKENQNIIFDEMNNSKKTAHIRLYDFKYFQEDHLKKFIAVHPEFLPLLMNNDFEKWYPIFKDEAKENIALLGSNVIQEILKEDEGLMTKLLESFNQFNLSKDDFKLLLIIEKMNNKKVEKHRNIYIDIALRKEIKPNVFNEYSQDVITQYKENKIDEDMTKAILINLKKLLPKRVLREIRLADQDIFEKVLNQVDIFTNLNKNKP